MLAQNVINASEMFHFDLRFLVARNAGIFLANSVVICSMRLWTLELCDHAFVKSSSARRSEFGAGCRAIVNRSTRQRDKSRQRPSDLRIGVREAQGKVGSEVRCTGDLKWGGEVPDVELNTALGRKRGAPSTATLDCFEMCFFLR